MAAYWEYAGASVQGDSHAVTGTPCHDFWSADVSPNGKWIAIAVCDGAGSAAKAEEGSEFVAKLFVEKLIDLSIDLENRAPGAWVNDYIIQSVLDTRLALRDSAKTDLLSDYHTTLVACLQGPSGGFAMHIGDGAVVGGYTKKNASSSVFVSNPHNGEYANETFFITENDWPKNLRISPMPPTDWIILVTDGGWSLSMDRHGALDQSRLTPLLESIKEGDCDTRSKKIVDWLSKKEFKPLTSDDKTLVMAFRDGAAKTDLCFVGPLSSKQPTANRPLAGNQSFSSIELQQSRCGLSYPSPPVRRFSVKSFVWVAMGVLVGLIGALSFHFFSDFDFVHSVESIIQREPIELDSPSKPVLPHGVLPVQKPKEEIRT